MSKGYKLIQLDESEFWESPNPHNNAYGWVVVQSVAKGGKSDIFVLNFCGISRGKKVNASDWMSNRKWYDAGKAPGQKEFELEIASLKNDGRKKDFYVFLAPNPHWFCVFDPEEGTELFIPFTRLKKPKKVEENQNTEKTIERFALMEV